MIAAGREGSLVTLICDSGDRYATTYYNPGWLATNSVDITPWRAQIEHFLETGEMRPVAG